MNALDITEWIAPFFLYSVIQHECYILVKISRYMKFIYLFWTTHRCYNHDAYKEQSNLNAQWIQQAAKRFEKRCNMKWQNCRNCRCLVRLVPRTDHSRPAKVNCFTRAYLLVMYCWHVLYTIMYYSLWYGILLQNGGKSIEYI